MRKQTHTKQQLMETAIQLIWQSNYSNVGVAEICKQAGVTKGGFYHYFETKADLFYEASSFYWESMKQDMDAIFSPSYSAVEQLENLINFIIKKQDTTMAGDENPVSGCPFFTAGGQSGSGEKKVRQAAQEMAEKAVKYNMALIRNLHASDALNCQADPEQIGRMIYQYVMGLLLYGRVVRSIDVVKQDLREAIYRIIDLKNEFRQDSA